MFWKATDRVSRLNYPSSESDWKRPRYGSITKRKSLLSLGVGRRGLRSSHHARAPLREMQAATWFVFAEVFFHRTLFFSRI